MIRNSRWIFAWVLGAALFLVGISASKIAAQSSNQPSAPQLSAEQQKQVDQLKQYEDRLQKDRDALHAAITQYGWDSEQTDAAQDQLSRDRTEYRKLRRSLRAAGVPVPPPAGFGQGGPGNRGAGPGWRMHQRGHHGRGMCNCPCCD